MGFLWRYALHVHKGHVSSCVAVLCAYSSWNSADTTQVLRLSSVQMLCNHSRPSQTCHSTRGKWETMRLCYKCVSLHEYTFPHSLRKLKIRSYLRGISSERWWRCDVLMRQAVQEENTGDAISMPLSRPLQAPSLKGSLRENNKGCFLATQTIIMRAAIRAITASLPCRAILGGVGSGKTGYPTLFWFGVSCFVFRAEQIFKSSSSVS